MGPALTEALSGRTLASLTDDELAALRARLGHSIPVADENQIDDEQERRHAHAKQASIQRVVITGIDISIGDLTKLYLMSLVAAIPVGLLIAIVYWALAQIAAK